MELFLVEGYIVRRAGEFTTNESFSGFIEYYSLTPDTITLDDDTHPASNVVVESIKAVSVNSASRLRLKITPATAKEKVPTKGEALLAQIEDEINKMADLIPPVEDDGFQEPTKAQLELKSILNWFERTKAIVMVSERSKSEHYASSLLRARREFMAAARSIYSLI